MSVIAIIAIRGTATAMNIGFLIKLRTVFFIVAVDSVSLLEDFIQAAMMKITALQVIINSRSEYAMPRILSGFIRKIKDNACLLLINFAKCVNDYGCCLYFASWKKGDRSD